ncbi:branched-chain amino acid aminotransferase [Salmonella enterica subsp. enterica serovar Sanjuan]|uniref:Branched-chain amino acid aminotransferase n=1 Tax=Salmonella enterica subsp. enterica serovar Sanjuan TaxID=1160765 RepID=A0A3S4EZQ8_SALET|nr:branched-chain amino acid aminotransferase [Salmonella enterica subsp. enterica serovar Sanjuan]
MEACRDVIRKNNLTSAYIRPLVFVGDVGMGVNPPPGYTTDVIIAAFPWGGIPGRRSAGSGDRCDGFFLESRCAEHHSNRR